MRASRRSTFYVALLVLVCVVIFLLMTSLIEQLSATFAINNPEQQAANAAVAAVRKQHGEDDEDDEDPSATDAVSGNLKKGGKRAKKRRLLLEQGGESGGVVNADNDDDDETELVNGVRVPKQRDGLFDLLQAMNAVFWPCSFTAELNESQIIDLFLPRGLHPLRNFTALEEAKRWKEEMKRRATAMINNASNVTTTTASTTPTTPTTLRPSSTTTTSSSSSSIQSDPIVLADDVENNNRGALPFLAVQLDKTPRNLGVAGGNVPHNDLQHQQQQQQIPVFTAVDLNSGDSHKALRAERKRLQKEQQQQQQQQQRHQLKSKFKPTEEPAADDAYQKRRKKELHAIHYDIKHNQHRCMVTRQFSAVPLYPLTISRYEAPFLFPEHAPTLYGVAFSWRELAHFDFDFAFLSLTKQIGGTVEIGKNKEERLHQPPLRTAATTLPGADKADAENDDYRMPQQRSQRTEEQRAVENQQQQQDQDSPTATAAGDDDDSGLQRPLTPNAPENMRIFFAWKYQMSHSGRIPSEEQFDAWLRNISARVATTSMARSVAPTPDLVDASASSFKFCDFTLLKMKLQQQQKQQDEQQRKMEAGDDGATALARAIGDDAAATTTHATDNDEDDTPEKLLRREYEQLQKNKLAMRASSAAVANKRKRGSRRAGVGVVARRWSLRPKHSYTVSINRTRIWEHLIPDIRMAYATEIERCHAAGARMVAILVSVLEKHNMRVYFLTHGSLLGAYRNGGALPWDVDIDIAMPEGHMKFLRKVWRSEFPRDMFLQTEQTDPDFSMYTARRIQIRIKDRYSCAHGIPTVIKRGKALVKVRKTHHGFGIDLIPLEKRSKGKQYKVWHNFFNTSDIFPLSTISFNGVLVPAPRRVNRVLSTLYGDDFATNVKHPPAHFGGVEAFPILSTYTCPGSAWGLNWTAERTSSVEFLAQQLQLPSKDNLRPWQQEVLQERAKHYEHCVLSPRHDPI